MAQVFARNWWTQTPLVLEAGKKYRFAAFGTWKDASNECTAAGYTSKKLAAWEWTRRVRTSKWFAVIGVIDKQWSTRFDIGRLIEDETVFQAHASGTLYCFANDAWLMYWNNSGSIDLSMEPVVD